MSKFYKILALLFIFQIISNCSENKPMEIRKLTLNDIGEYLKSNRSIDIENYCGKIDSIPLIFNHNKLFLSMKVYNKSYNKTDILDKKQNPLCQERLKKSFLVNLHKGLLLDSDSLKTLRYNSFLEKIKNKTEAEIYFILNWKDLEETKNQQKFILLLKELNKLGYVPIIEYKSKLYYLDGKTKR